MKQEEYDRRLRAAEDAGRLPVRGSNRGVPYLYKVHESVTGEWTGEYVELRFVMGKAPATYAWDYGRQVLRRAYTAPGVSFKGSGWAGKS